MLISGHQSHGRLIQQTQKTRKKHGACSLASIAMTGERGGKNKNHTFTLLSFSPAFLSNELRADGGCVLWGYFLLFACSRSEPKRHGMCFLCLLDFLVSKAHITMEPSTAFTFSIGDSVELLTEEQNMQCDWQISAIQGNTIRIMKCDSSDVREVNCSDLIYMPF